MAGIASLLNAERGVAQGNLNPELYNLSSSVPAAFHDVTVSSSGVVNCTVKTPSMCNNSVAGPKGLANGQSGYLVTSGYDLVTGLGSLDVQEFLNNFAGNRATPTLTIAASTNITTAQPDNVIVTITGNGADPPTGSVALTSGTYTSAAVAFSDGQASFIIPAGALPVGNDTLAAAYTPDTSSEINYNPASGSVPITVTAAPLITPVVVLQPNSSVVTTAQSLQVSISLSVGAGNTAPTGSITLTSSTFSSTVNGPFNTVSQLTIPPQTLPVGQDTLTATYTPDPASSSIYSSATGTASVT